MTVPGYPGPDVYPGEDVYPGLPEFRATFETPTQDIAFPMEGSLTAMLPHALSVWRIDGVWAQGFAPSPETVAAADRFYRGGYVHEVDTAAIEELTTAGYGAYITVIEEVAS